jgi:hypothetical protein
MTSLNMTSLVRLHFLHNNSWSRASLDEKVVESWLINKFSNIFQSVSSRQVVQSKL